MFDDFILCKLQLNICIDKHFKTTIEFTSIFKLQSTDTYYIILCKINICNSVNFIIRNTILSLNNCFELKPKCIQKKQSVLYYYFILK